MQQFIKNNITITFIIIVGMIITGFIILSKQEKQHSIIPNNEPTPVNQTIISAKPRNTVIEYQVKPGDTVPSIAEKFNISVNTIKWANKLETNDVVVGSMLKIPPVTGVVHTVMRGETIETIASRYKTTSENIKNFPFNEFKNLQTYDLTLGQTLYVPDGVME